MPVSYHLEIPPPGTNTKFPALLSKQPKSYTTDTEEQACHTIQKGGSTALTSFKKFAEDANSRWQYKHLTVTYFSSRPYNMITQGSYGYKY